MTSGKSWALVLVLVLSAGLRWPANVMPWAGPSDVTRWVKRFVACDDIRLFSLAVWNSRNSRSMFASDVRPACGASTWWGGGRRTGANRRDRAAGWTIRPCPPSHLYRPDSVTGIAINCSSDLAAPTASGRVRAEADVTGAHPDAECAEALSAH